VTLYATRCANLSSRVGRWHELRMVLTCSPLDTDLERISLGGPRIKDLPDLLVIESGAQTRLRTLSVLTAYEYRS
jgi:hypothetical protein